MRSFTSYLNRSVRPEWDGFYLDYASLKNLLEKFAERRTHIGTSNSVEEIKRFYPETDQNLSQSFEFHKLNDYLAPSSGSNKRGRSSEEGLNDYVAKLEREEFCHVLDAEVEKIGKLYRQQLVNLKADVQRVEQEINQGGKAVNENANQNLGEDDATMKVNNQSLIDEYIDKYQEIGNEILELHAYISTNILALRQILIRYDSLIRTLDGPPLGQWYIRTRREDFVKDYFEAIFVRHELLLMTDTLEFSMKNSEPVAKSFYGFDIDVDSSQTYDEKRDMDKYIKSVRSIIGEMENVVLTAELAVEKAHRGRLAPIDSIVYSLRNFFLAGSIMNELVMQPSFIRTRGVKLKKEIRFFAKWRETKSVPNNVPNHENKSSKASSFKDLLHASLILNFASQFLYMMNHYIIEPSSTQYVHELGGRDALSGLLIGMTPWAGLISAFVYSFWSNKNFRQPLICSGVCLTLGSLLYANALKFESIGMAMAGRFMTGLGAPCGLNVRFMADTVTKVNRTAVSAVLVTVSALGMSLGPFFAVLLDFCDVDMNIPIFGEVIINGMTGPGYLMSILWGIYLVFLMIYFEESERFGLLEIVAKSRMEQNEYDPPSIDQAYSIDTTIYSEDEDDNLEVEDELMPSKTTRYLNEATVICMCMKFIGKFVLELMGCSVSLITRHRYDWSVRQIGALSFVNGLLVIPISTSIGYLSQYYTDITMLFWLLGIAFCGLFILFDFTDLGADPNEDGYNYNMFWAVRPWRYIVGIVMEFCGFQAAQSVILSMLSKVVPLKLAKGTFNAGFITTILSTLARANGDVLITIMGLVSLRQLLNLLVLPSILLTGFCIMISRFHAHKLSV